MCFGHKPRPSLSIVTTDKETAAVAFPSTFVFPHQLTSIPSLSPSPSPSSTTSSSSFQKPELQPSPLQHRQTQKTSSNSSSRSWRKKLSSKFRNRGYDANGQLKEDYVALKVVDWGDEW
ncbi:hypothetical protein MMC06_004501 [Schaereria dolodes]|nr:hypothetical protein [Schaereria dolodes]